MSDARKRAEEALASALVTLSNKPRYADLFDEVSNLRDALRAVLAEAPTAPPADAATEAVPNDGVVLADFLHRNALAADACHNCKSDDCECISTPAPAPSAKEGRT